MQSSLTPANAELTGRRLNEDDTGVNDHRASIRGTVKMMQFLWKPYEDT